MTSRRLPLRRRVDRLVADRDAAEREPEVVPRRLVVVAGDVDDLRALARLAQHLLDDVVVRLVPVPAALQLPAVDDVADEVQVVGFGAAQEFEQRPRLAAGRAEVGVGDEDGTESESIVPRARGSEACRRQWRPRSTPQPGCRAAGPSRRRRLAADQAVRLRVIGTCRASDRVHAGRASVFMSYVR